MRKVWDRLEQWLKQNAPMGLVTLQEGATIDQIKETEQFLSVEFPEDVKASYHIHNGQADFRFGFMLGEEYAGIVSAKDIC